MKNLIGFFLVLSLAACVPQAKTNNAKTSTTTGSGSSGQTNFSFPANTSTPNYEIDSGSGSGTVIVLPTPTPEPTPGLTEYCGKLYISKSGVVMFIDEEEHYRVIDPETYNAQQVVNNITFPSDAFNACVHGNLVSGGLFYIIRTEYIQLSDGIVNPERATRKSSYSYEICGNLMFKTDPGQTTAWIQMQVGTSYKIIQDDASNTYKNYLNAHGNTQGCLYNNAGFTKNTYVTFKQYFKPDVSDLGW
ncbi:MAG: hypothetical protein A2X86_10745 [Bdellovibrionales bacterium GWA2_49_15]|nr:MAG: hypothetical protein A2X86_10745 [Bdellovibrionales bacterium GWA2_49_15]HAZ11453.1 hypothetical protein [Bdellovibrionales bacterium]